MNANLPIKKTSDRRAEIVAALKSGDPTDHAWALNELRSMPPDVVEKICRRYGINKESLAQDGDEGQKQVSSSESSISTRASFLAKWWPVLLCLLIPVFVIIQHAVSPSNDGVDPQIKALVEKGQIAEAEAFVSRMEADGRRQNGHLGGGYNERYARHMQAGVARAREYIQDKTTPPEKTTREEWYVYGVTFCITITVLFAILLINRYLPRVLNPLAKCRGSPGGLILVVMGAFIMYMGYEADRISGRSMRLDGAFIISFLIICAGLGIMIHPIFGDKDRR